MNYPTYDITQDDHDLVEAQIQEQLAKSNSYLKPHPSLGLGALAELQTVAWLKDIGANPKWNCGLWDRDITAGNLALDVKHTCTHFSTLSFIFYFLFQFHFYTYTQDF